MNELVKVTDEFITEVNELMGLVMHQCTIKNLANMSNEEIEMARAVAKLVMTSNELIKNYQETFDEMNSKLDIIAKLLVKENEGQK